MEAPNPVEPADSGGIGSEGTTRVCLPSSGKQVTVQDLAVPSAWLHKSVNVIGRLEEHNVATCRVKLGAPKQKHTVTVDTTLVEPFDAKLRSLCQFVGEVKEGNSGEDDDGDTVVVEARVVRNVDGLDLVMYEQALKAQRQYLDGRRIDKE